MLGFGGRWGSCDIFWGFFLGGGFFLEGVGGNGRDLVGWD